MNTHCKGRNKFSYRSTYVTENSNYFVSQKKYFLWRNKMKNHSSCDMQSTPARKSVLYSKFKLFYENSASQYLLITRTFIFISFHFPRTSRLEPKHTCMYSRTQNFTEANRLLMWGEEVIITWFPTRLIGQ